MVAGFNHAKMNVNDGAGKTNAIPLTNRCIFRYSCHIIVTHKFRCMIIYVAYRYIYIAHSHKYTIVSLNEFSKGIKREIEKLGKHQSDKEKMQILRSVEEK